MPAKVIKVKLDMDKVTIVDKLKRHIEEENVDVWTDSEEWIRGKAYPYTYIWISREMQERMNDTFPTVFGIKQKNTTLLQVPFRIHRDVIVPV